MYTDMHQYIDEDFTDDPFSESLGRIIYAKRHFMNILISDKPGAAQKLPNQE